MHHMPCHFGLRSWSFRLLLDIIVGIDVHSVAACLAFDMFSPRLTQVLAFHRLALLPLNMAFLARPCRDAS